MVALCRLCASLKKTEFLISVKEETKEICEKIHRCCDVKIQMHDAMPKNICMSCMEKLNLSYDFYTKVQEAQETLKEFYPSKDIGLKSDISVDTQPMQNRTRRSGPSTSSEVECMDVARKKIVKKEKDAKNQRKLKANEGVISPRKENSTTLKSKQKQLQKNTEQKVVEHLELTDDAGGEGYLQEVYNILGLNPDYAKGESRLDQQLKTDNYFVTFCNKENEENATTQAHGGVYLEQEDEQRVAEMLVEQRDDVQFEVDEFEAMQEAIQDDFQFEVTKMDVNSLVGKEQWRDDALAVITEIESITSFKYIKHLCYVCNCQIPSFNDLVQHAAAMHSITDMNKLLYKCSYCCMVLSHYSDFVNHIRLQHHCELLLRCDACDKLCKNNKQYKLHRDLQCTEKMKYPIVFTCPICTQSFSSHTSRQVHIRQHLDVKKFTCKNCPSSFPSKIALKVHKNEHKQIKHLFPCDKCNKFYMSKSSLAVHKKNHNGDNIYECDICNKRYNAQILLDKHIISHTKKKPFKCTFCPRQFRTKIEQTTHERVHTGEMPLQCNLCEKSFRFRSTLAAHLKTHSDVRMYACTFCERRFNDLSNYKKHARRKHADKSEELQHAGR